MFIPISSVKLIKDYNTMALRICLKPFKTKLEDLFVNDFRTLFSYDSQRICMNLDVYDIREPIILRVVLMNFTGDYHAYLKARLLKGGGHLTCRRHNIFACRERILKKGEMSLYEHNREYV
jgi:hypothetical protein